MKHEGKIVSAEFVRSGDLNMSGEEAEPGTYVTIKLDDENAKIGPGKVLVEWKIYDKKLTSGK